MVLAFLSFELFHSPCSYAETTRFLERTTPGFADEHGSSLSSTPTRKRIDLVGPWTYVLENGEAGTVQVPSSYDFVGTVDFQRTFEISSKGLDIYRYFLVVEGANYSCDVSINGEFIGNHAGGCTPFTIQIPPEDLQASKDNTIRLRVNNELDARATLPLRPLTWGARNYGGIHRDIYILATPKVFLRDASIESRLPAVTGGPGRVFVTPQIEGVLTVDSAGTAFGFACEVVEAVTGLSVGRSAVVPLQEKDNAWSAARKAEVVIAAPRLWSPDTPDLYIVKCQLVRLRGKDTSLIDEYRLPYGLCSVELRDGDIFMNGKRLVVRAVSWYEAHPNWGSAIPPEERERDIVQIKNLGANAIRFVGCAPDPIMLDLCDRYGLCAMEELPLAQCPAGILGTETYQDLAAGMMREMVLRDRHHPSVLAWGIGDELQCEPHHGGAFITRVLESLHALDGRPSYRGLRLGVVDSCRGVTDIEVVNVYVSDAKQTKAALEEWRAERRDIVTFARFGYEVDHENLKGFNDPLSQQAQARFLMQRLEYLRTLDFDGAIIWSFNDWQGDRPALTVHTGDPWKHSMGLVSDRRERRLSYEAVRAGFRGERGAALSAGSYAPRAPIIYVLVGFVALILVAYVYNANRRFREHVNRSLLNSYNFFADVRDQYAVSVVHTTFLALIVSVATAIVLSSVALHFRDSLFLDNLLSYVLVFDDVKAAMVRLIWDPLRFIGVLTLILFVFFLLLSGLVHQARLVMKARVFAFHAYTATIWSATPLLALIPVGMILYRVMEGPVYVASSLIVVAVLFVWVLLRFMKAVSIVYDVYPPKMLAIGFLVLAACCGFAYLYFDRVQSAPMYLSFLYSMVGAGR